MEAHLAPGWWAKALGAIRILRTPLGFSQQHPRLYIGGWVALGLPAHIPLFLWHTMPFSEFHSSPSSSQAFHVSVAMSWHSDSMTDVEEERHDNANIIRGCHVLSSSPIPEGPPVHIIPGLLFYPDLQSQSSQSSQASQASQGTQGTQITWPVTRPVSRASTRPPSRASSRASTRPPTRSARRRAIVPGDDDLNHLNTLDTSRPGFRFNAKTYWLTWSQLGDVPNSALDDKMASFGDLISGVSLQLCHFTLKLIGYNYSVEGC